MLRSATRALRAILVPLACLNVLVLLVVAGALPALAQGNRVEGIVRDATGASVPHAQVELRAPSYSATTSTDPAGTFVFDNVPEASGTLRITAKGLKPVEAAWNIAAGAPAHVEVVLEPLPLAQRIIVTAARTETRLGDSPVSVLQLTRDDLEATPSLTLDDALRQIPGFGFFRRTSGRTAALGTHSVSLRGLGATSAGRTLLLEDGIPLNDPFSSSDYWDRVPAESVASVEVAQEGASSLYGSDALGGVVQLRTRPAQPAGLSLETSYGNQNTPDLSLWAGGQAGRWEATFGGEVFQTDGYILVPEPFRGSVDVKARAKHGTADLMIGRHFGSKPGAQSEIFARGWFFDSAHVNGTPDTTNDIRLGEGALGANLQLGAVGSLTLRFYGEAQIWHQGFSSVAPPNRNSETLTNRQTVPAQGVGGSAVWSRGLGKRQTLVAGFDDHEEIGHSNEIQFSSVTGNHTRDTSAGGHQSTVGFFGEDLIQIAPRWILSVSARFDHWRNFDAFSQCVPFALSCPPPTLYPNQSYDAFSPRLSLLHQMNSHVSWSGSVYRGFRAPTLNELYRSFRQANTLTNNNPNLREERLTGGEAGVNVNGFDRRLEVRGVVFFNEIINPVANVTCPTPGAVPPCPAPIPNTIIRVKRNLGRTSAPGIAIDATARLTGRLQLSGGYQYVNATVISSPGQTPSLVGRWIAQVPHNVLTFQARYTNPSRINLSVTGRMGGRQFDDDLNNFSLGRYFVLDVMASRPIRGGVEFFVAVENLLNQSYATGYASTPPTVPVAIPQLGLPIAARFGVRFQWHER